MHACVICDQRHPVPGVALCDACAGALTGDVRRAPGIVSSRVHPGQARAWLIDAWGQPHAVGERCRIGRDAARSDLVVAELLVSNEHAELWRDRGEWVARDRGSANGTCVGNGGRVREGALPHRAMLWVGPVGFYFWAQRTFPAGSTGAPRVQTLIPAPSAFQLVSKGRGELTVRAAHGHQAEHAPGEVEYIARRRTSVRLALGRLQFQLLRRLCEAAVQANAASSAVSTRELLDTLPFQTARPEPNHVRQVVATLRSALERAGVPGGGSSGADAVVEAHQGLGYRLTWSVTRLEPR
jgi:hypothetical protein